MFGEKSQPNSGTDYVSSTEVYSRRSSDPACLIVVRSVVCDVDDIFSDVITAAGREPTTAEYRSWFSDADDK